MISKFCRAPGPEGSIFLKKKESERNRKVGAAHVPDLYATDLNFWPVHRSPVSVTAFAMPLLLKSLPVPTSLTPPIARSFGDFTREASPIHAASAPSAIAAAQKHVMSCYHPLPLLTLRLILLSPLAPGFPGKRLCGPLCLRSFCRGDQSQPIYLKPRAANRKPIFDALHSSVYTADYADFCVLTSCLFLLRLRAQHIHDNSSDNTGCFKAESALLLKNLSISPCPALRTTPPLTP